MVASRVFVTGVGAISAIGHGFGETITALRNGHVAAGPVSAFDASSLPGSLGCEVQNFDPADHFPGPMRKRMDRSSHLALVAAREALAQAGIALSTVDGDRAAVSLGSTLGGLRNTTAFYERYRAGQRVSPGWLVDNQPLTPANRLAHEFGFHGGSFLFSNACASGNSAIAYGMDLIDMDEADLVVAGGYDTMAKLTMAGFNTMRNVSATACRPFDRDRDGLILGEGAGVVVLEREDHARARGALPLAEVLAYGQTTDAKHMTAPDPTARGPAEAMRRALEGGGVDTGDVDYINAHGTGTPHNDEVEARAIHRLFGHHAETVPVASTKSMHGHTLGAAGGLEAVATIASMVNDFVPGTPTFTTPDDPPLPGLGNRTRAQRVRIALSNTFGFGGSNCCILMRRPDHV